MQLSYLSKGIETMVMGYKKLSPGLPLRSQLCVCEVYSVTAMFCSLGWNEPELRALVMGIGNKD